MKQITIDYDLYRQELRAEYSEGYSCGLDAMLRFLRDSKEKSGELLLSDIAVEFDGVSTQQMKYIAQMIEEIRNTK